MRPTFSTPAATAAALLAAGALATAAGAQTGSPVAPASKAEKQEAADAVSAAVLKEARKTSAAKLLDEREIEVGADNVLAGAYTIRVKRKGSGPTVLSGKDAPDSGSFSELEADVKLSNTGRSYLRTLRERSARTLTFEVSVGFTPKDGGSSVKSTETYRQRIKG